MTNKRTGKNKAPSVEYEEFHIAESIPVLTLENNMIVIKYLKNWENYIILSQNF